MYVYITKIVNKDNINVKCYISFGTNLSCFKKSGRIIFNMNLYLENEKVQVVIKLKTLNLP